MKVLTLHQPWASLVALGVKTVETRSWSTNFRGPLAIHAASRRPDPRPVGDWLPYSGLSGGWALEHYASGEIGAPPDAVAPLGAIVATCTLVDVVPMLGMDRPTPLNGGWVRIGQTALGLNRGGPADHMEFVDAQRPYGDFTPGRYAWLLADIVPVDPPVPFRGGRSLSMEWEPVATCQPEA